MYINYAFSPASTWSWQGGQLLWQSHLQSFCWQQPIHQSWCQSLSLGHGPPGAMKYIPTCRHVCSLWYIRYYKLVWFKQHCIYMKFTPDRYQHIVIVLHTAVCLLAFSVLFFIAGFLSTLARFPQDNEVLQLLVIGVSPAQLGARKTNWKQHIIWCLECVSPKAMQRVFAPLIFCLGSRRVWG